MINSIVHVNVVVSNIERSLKFYCDLLGGHIVGGTKKESIINRKTESKGVGIGLGLGERAGLHGGLQTFHRFVD